MKYDVIRSYWPAPIYDTDTALLALDFTAGAVPTALTFTRADSTARATFIDASGYVKTVASAGAARFDYTGGVAKGLLIEAAATNIMFRSQAINTSPWFNAGTMTISQTGAGSPANDSTSNTVTWTNSTGAGGAWLQQVVSVSGSQLVVGTAYTWSVWLKSRGGRRVNFFAFLNGTSGNVELRVDFGVSPPTVTATSSTGWTSIQTPSIVEYPNGWYKVTTGGTVPASTTSVSFGMSNSDSVPATGTNGYEAWGFQLEANSAASSYIPTTSSTLQRLADDAVIRSTAWTSLYAQPGAMVVEFYRGAYGAGSRSVLATDTTAARHWDLLHANGSATAQIAFSSGSAVTQTGLVSGLNKVALAWNAPTPTASFDLCVNGATPTFGGSNVGTTLSTWLTLGSQSTTGVSGSGTWDNYLNNSIKSVKYYTGLTYAEMQAKTT
jgi:hypothetical protein